LNVTLSNLRLIDIGYKNNFLVKDFSKSYFHLMCGPHIAKNAVY